MRVSAQTSISLFQSNQDSDMINKQGTEWFKVHIVIRFISPWLDMVPA